MISVVFINICVFFYYLQYKSPFFFINMPKYFISFDKVYALTL
jgi:hypothetical protein